MCRNGRANGPPKRRLRDSDERDGTRNEHLAFLENSDAKNCSLGCAALASENCGSWRGRADSRRRAPLEPFLIHRGLVQCAPRQECWRSEARLSPTGGPRRAAVLPHQPTARPENPLPKWPPTIGYTTFSRWAEFPQDANFCA